MTANAMRGDRERCFEAGMEDYLSKPIDVEELVEALLRSRPIAGGSGRPRRVDAPTRADGVASNGAQTPGSEDGMDVEGESAPSLDPDPAVPTLDLSVLQRFVEQLGDDGWDVVREIIDVFLQDVPKMLAELRGAADASDARTVDRSAHTLKSSSASLGGLAMARLCADLEARAHGGSLDGAVESVERIGHEYERLRDALSEARPR